MSAGSQNLGDLSCGLFLTIVRLASASGSLVTLLVAVPADDGRCVLLIGPAASRCRGRLLVASSMGRSLTADPGR